MEYRKKKGSDTWHWCKNCSKWPKSDYIKKTEPIPGEKCNECLSKEKNKECEK